MALRTSLLLLLGLLWSIRLSAIKAAGLAGLPVHVVVVISVIGIATFFTGLALVRRVWPPVGRDTVPFYLISGILGFLAPFALESAVAPHLAVFVFVVIIATMPLMTFALSVLTGGERFRLLSILAVGLGFIGAWVILWDTTRAGGPTDQNWSWALIAFGVPLLYAVNTVFVATRWPARATAIHVAHAQSVLVAVCGGLGSLVTGAVADWPLAVNAAPTLGLIVAGEGLALLVYLRIARDFGATYVSFANYASILFAAVIGALWFGDRLSATTCAAAALIVGAVILYQRQTPEGG